MFATLRFLFLNVREQWVADVWLGACDWTERDCDCDFTPKGQISLLFFFPLRTGRIQRFAVKNTLTLPPLTMPANKPDRKKVKAAPQKVLGDRSEKDEAERDLEALVFGGDVNDMWDKTGHELSDNEADQVEIYDENDVEEKEQGNDQVILCNFATNRWYL